MAGKHRKTLKTAPPTRPLEGTTILDLTQQMPGAAATMILANFGAEVIKIEEPGKGDYARELPPFIHGAGATFTLLNRGKKSVAIKLRNRRGKLAFLRLAQRADVVIEGFRPGVMKRLGLDYQTLRRRNERLVYAALTSYGQSGPYAQMPGHDLNYLSLGGVLNLLSLTEGPPALPGVQIADLAAGSLPTVIGVLLALMAREKTGRGQMVDLAMLDGVAELLSVSLSTYTATRQVPQPGSGPLSGLCACYNVYPTRNGRWVAVAALEPKFWAVLCRELEREDLIPDQYASGDRQKVLIAELTRIFQKKEAREWFEFFKDKNTCLTVVQNLPEAVRDEHLRERQTIVSIEHPKGGSYDHLGVIPKLSETPGQLGGEPPQLGQHTLSVLKRVGLKVKELDSMKRTGVIEG